MFQEIINRSISSRLSQINYFLSRINSPLATDYWTKSTTWNLVTSLIWNKLRKWWKIFLRVKNNFELCNSLSKTHSSSDVLTVLPSYLSRDSVKITDQWFPHKLLELTSMLGFKTESKIVFSPIIFYEPKPLFIRWVMKPYKLETGY